MQIPIKNKDLTSDKLDEKDSAVIDDGQDYLGKMDTTLNDYNKSTK